MQGHRPVLAETPVLVAGERPSWRVMFSPLGNPQFRWLYLSNLCFFLGMGMQQTVRVWIAFELTGSEFDLGKLSFALAGGMFFLGPVGGVIADRRERRNLVGGSQLLVIAAELGVLALLASDRLAFWHLIPAALAMGCAFPFMMPARHALVANLVGRTGLASATALNMVGMNATRILGPALAGVLIGLVGVTLTFATGVALYILASLCLLRVRRSPPEVDAREVSVARSLADGVSYVGENRLVLTLLLFGVVPVFIAAPFQVLLVVFAKETWAVGAAGFGTLLAVSGVGGLLGAIWAAWRANHPGRLRSMMLSMVGFGGFLIFFAQSPWYLPALGYVLLASACSSFYGTLNQIAIQLLIPDHVRGRISSFLMMSFSLPMLGTLPLSKVAELYGVEFAVTAASIAAILVALLFYLSSPELRNMDTTVERALRE